MPESEDVIGNFDHHDFSVAMLQELKGETTVAVCIPARDEEQTIASIATVVVEELVKELGLVDEFVVVDDGSIDQTAAVAERAGARVVPSVPRESGESPRSLGKGGAMRRGLEVTTADLLVYLDGDVTNFAPHFVLGLLGPLLSRPSTGLVKGYYARPIEGDASGGGRVTELTAWSILALLFPELRAIFQPLAGETAGRREVLSALAFEPGYGVEMGLLLDVAANFGIGALAQVDLGVRVHRNRSLAALAPQAREVLDVALRRSSILPR